LNQNLTAVAIASGGLDSTTLLYKLRQEGERVSALTFLYGQRHKREVESAKEICGLLGVEHTLIDLTALKPLFTSSALTNELIRIPNVPESVEHYDTLKTTIVPNRNAIFISVAVARAISVGANNVYFGVHASDRGVYPDCRPGFVEALQTALRLGTDNHSLRIIAPFLNMTKGDIVKLGTRLEVPYSLTWSCYNGGVKHCGVCSSCRERKRAFLEAGLNDPTEYSE
jgi:7-cyano-7-deazaguanine synthase